MIGANAIILSAGLGVRMRPITDNRPKPLVQVNGKSLIDFGLGKLRDIGVSKVIVNVHYFADQMEAWARGHDHPVIEISDERQQILDTGGGIAKALPRLGDAPFFVLNSDSIWVDEKHPALEVLRDKWRDGIMDCLLLLCPLERAIGYSGTGDFVMESGGKLKRSGTPPGRPPFVYMGAFLVHPRLFADAPDGKFSMNVLWDKAISNGRLHGLIHEGMWFHVGTPGDLALAEARLPDCP